MFKEPFNFSLQRTPLQAFGWYLVFLALSLLLGMIVGQVVFRLGLIPDDFKSGARVGTYFAPIIPVLVSIAVIIPRPLSARNVLITVLAIAVSFILGWFGAGVLLAYLTTTPPRASSANIASTFE